jgi:Flp pilus assembly protein TadD
MADTDDLTPGMTEATVEPPAPVAPAGLMRQFHRIAFVVLLAALVVAMVAPAWAARRPPTPDPAAALAAAAAPPGPQALALLDAAIAEGRMDAARSLIAPMWANGAPDVVLRAAELALASGSLPEAAEGFSSLTTGALGNASLQGPALQGLGITRLKQGRIADAVAALDQAVAADAGLARAWNARAVIADRQRDWATADSAYAKAIAAQPGEAAWLANRGWSHLLRGHHVAAEQDLAAALALKADLVPARTNLALARAMQGRYQDAFRQSDKKTLAADLNTVGYAAMARGDLGVAEAYFNRALSLNPQFDRAAWANLQYLVALKGEGGRPQ